MTKHERALIRLCTLDGFHSQRKLRYSIGLETISWDRLNAIMEEMELALDKQEPIKPSLIYQNRIGLCSCCENAIDKTMKYCDQCGQKIDWEEENDD